MHIYYGSLHLKGCTLSGNSATDRGNDINNDGGATVNIDGCPAGFSGAAGAALDASNDGGTITGEAKSHSCVACVR